MNGQSRIVMAATVTAVCGLLTLAAIAQPQGLDGYQVLNVAIADSAQRDALLAIDESCAEMEIWSHDLGGETIEVRVSPEAKLALDEEGFSYEVEIEDLQQHLDELFGGERDGDFFDQYRTYDEHVTFMEELVAAYPKLAGMINLGESVQGRPMWAIRITGPGRKKPGVLYHGAQHGNEIMGAPVIAYTARYLLTNYDADPKVKSLVDGVEWFLLPIMNPDGYPGRRGNANGVDLNRNWGGPGSRVSAFSQPETAHMRDFLVKHDNVRAHLDFHMSGQAIIWSWGHTRSLPQDHNTYDDIGEEMAELIRQSRGTRYDRRGTIHRTYYYVSGGSTDYCLGELDIWSVVFELGTSKNMPPHEIIPICKEILPTLLFSSAWVSDCNDNGVPDATDIAKGTSKDCNLNGIPDECESQNDCDDNRLLDICDFVETPDCNGNAIPDACDIAAGRSADNNRNGVPDECDHFCDSVSKLRAKCRGGKRKIKAVIKTNLPDRADLKLSLDKVDGQWVRIMNDGRGKAKWKKASAGEHKLRVDVCPHIRAKATCE